MAGDRRSAIRSLLGQLGRQASPSQVVDALAAVGIEVSETLVIKVRADLLRKEAKAERQRLMPQPHDKRRRRPQRRKIPPRPR